MVVAEGNVEDVADVLPWLEGAIKKHFPKANYEAPGPRPARRGATTAVAPWRSPQESTPAGPATPRSRRRGDRVQRSLGSTRRSTSHLAGPARPPVTAEPRVRREPR
jgi:hypothetical protein